MRKLLAGCVMTLSLLPFAASAQEEAPIITIHTDAYREIGPTNAFRIMVGSALPQTIDLDCGWGSNEYDLEQTYVDPEQGISGTWIPITVSEEGLIRIWGDPELIDAIDLEGGYVTEIEMPECRNLEVLALEHNALRQLDLSPFQNLYALYLTDNPFTPQTPFTLTGPKPALSILEMDIIDNVDPELNFSDFPSLQVIDAYHTLPLAKCDVSGCPGLLSLSLEMTSVDKLDLSNNPSLLHLNISDTRITDIDLSPCPLLQGLLVGHASGWVNTDVKLTSIDLSHNPNLNYFSGTGNLFTSIDLSNNPKIQNLYLSRNKLTSLDLSANRALYSVDLNRNDMDFATLPAPEETWGEYFYLQNDLPVARAIKTGVPLNLSSRVLREGTETFARAMRVPLAGDPEELDEALYTYENGKITFHEAISDSVYVEYHNTLFYEYSLRTTPFMVKSPEDYGKPSRIAGFTLAPEHNGTANITIGMAEASEESPKSIYIAVDNGEMKEYPVTASDLSMKNNVSITGIPRERVTVTIFVPEGEVLTALGLNGNKLDALDVTPATELQYLSARQCGLRSIYLPYNRCLRELDLRSNELYSLDLTGAAGGYEKNLLHTLDASRNQIEQITIVSTRAMQNLNLARNKIKEFSLKFYDNIRTLDLSGNLLSGEINLAYVTQATDINISNNEISSVVYDTFPMLESMKLKGNLLTLETLPSEFLSLGENYVYAPQQPLPILKKGSGVNLSSQDVNIDGHSTTFTWKYKDGTPLPEDKVEATGAAFRFPDPSIGTVYCEIANEAYPALSGEDAFRTTDMTVMGAPTTLVASFTTTASGNNGEVIVAASRDTQLFIDWRGDGVEFIPYDVTTTYIPYPEQKYYAGAEAKIYTYDDPSLITVFSLYNMPLSKCDYSRMTQAMSLNVGGAGLSDGQLLLPENAPIQELNLDGNNFTSFPWAGKYPELYYLVLSGSPLGTFDGTADKNLSILILSNCALTSATFDNPEIRDLDLSGNNFGHLTLAGLPNLDQLVLMQAGLTSVDLSAVSGTLRALSLAGNSLTFATLPTTADLPHLTVYYYGSQKPLEVNCVDGVVDLSDQAMVGDIPTEFYWFFGEIIEDPESGTVSGEQLIEGEEYVVENGVTTFLEEFKGQDKVICLMRNGAFPNTYLKTLPMNITLSGVEANLSKSDSLSDVFDLMGRRVKRNVTGATALDGLAPGIYILNGKKHIVR